MEVDLEDFLGDWIDFFVVFFFSLSFEVNFGLFEESCNFLELSFAFWEFFNVEFICLVVSKILSRVWDDTSWVVVCSE